MRIAMLLTLVLALTSASACQQRVVQRRGIGDPRLGQGGREPAPDSVKRKYDDGEFESRQ